MIDAWRGAIGIIGCALVGYGAWLHYPPLGFVAAGVLMLALGIIGTLRDR